MYVYFIECRGFIKIGTSNEPLRRLSHLQIGNPFELSLVYLIRAGNHAATLETLLHRKFKNACLRGEWYQLSLEAITDYLATTVRAPKYVKRGQKVPYLIVGSADINRISKSHESLA